MEAVKQNFKQVSINEAKEKDRAIALLGDLHLESLVA